MKSVCAGSDNPGGYFRKGKRIALRALNESDAPILYNGINDPEVTQFLKTNKPMSLQEEVEWIRALPGKKPGEIIFGIVLLKTGRLIGNMGLHHVNFIDGKAVTGSVIFDKSCWGKGYGTEAKMLVLEYAFNTLNLRKVCSSVLASNGRSIGCLKKCGYKQKGVHEQQIYRNGAYVDEILMAVFKEDFLKLWAKYKKKYLA